MPQQRLAIQLPCSDLSRSSFVLFDLIALQMSSNERCEWNVDAILISANTAQYCLESSKEWEIQSERSNEIDKKMGKKTIYSVRKRHWTPELYLLLVGMKCQFGKITIVCVSLSHSFTRTQCFHRVRVVSGCTHYECKLCALYFLVFCSFYFHPFFIFTFGF